MSNKAQPAPRSLERVRRLAAGSHAQRNRESGAARITGAAARELLDSNIAMRSLQVGEVAPDFELPDGTGRPLRLSRLLRRGPVVLTFYRGHWCRWCRGLLEDLEGAASEMRALGAQLVAVSPQTAAWSRATARDSRLSYAVLSDVENRVAKRFGLVYTLPAVLRWAYARLGVDLPAHNGSRSFELPVPATYVIAPDQRIVHAFVSPDYTRRPQASEILAALRGPDRLPALARA
jgi:peroxiredoxin